jgi:hypothetical protein
MILAHFTFSDQFMGLSGSSVSGSSHPTMSSGDNVDVETGENRPRLGEGVILHLHQLYDNNNNHFSDQKKFYITIKEQHLS